MTQPVDQKDDAAILAALRADDEAGLEALQRQHGPSVRRALAKRAPQQEDMVADAESFALQQLWQQRRALQHAENLGGLWLTIAKRRLYRVLRAQRVDQALSSERDPRQRDGNPTARVSPMIHDLRECIDQLAPLQRAIVIADLRTGASAEAAPIAAAFKTSVNSIYASRNQAYHKIRLLMQERGHDFDPKGGGR